jgi:hydrogenase maturation protease
MDLVIGIGNRLRNDDGIGPTLVECLDGRPGVEAHVVHQLTPELALRLGDADRVLFVDARLDGSGIRLETVAAAPPSGLGHTLTPAGLLDLAARAFGAAPPAWLLSVSGHDFGFGEDLSPGAIARLPEAAQRIDAWLTGR